jgi:hypothetical protein
MFFQHPMPAAILKPDCALSTALDEACISHARLLANPLTHAHASDYDGFFAAWPICNAQEIQLHTAVVRLNALIVACDDELNAIADATHQAVLLEVKNDRSSARYLRYFGDETVSLIKRPMLAGQLETMRGWVPSLIASTNAVLNALGERLAKAVTAADETVAARLAAEQENRDFRTIGARKTLIDSLNAARKALYGKLSELPHAHPELHLPATFAEQLFRHESSKKAEPVLTVDELKQAIIASQAKTGELESLLATALADAEKAAKDKLEREKAIAELQQADEVRNAAAAKLAALDPKKKT